MIEKLELVLALARERHFGRAAEACGVSQPTLSAGLRSLEDALGVLIIRRNSRFRDFTPEGRRILDWARQIVGDVDAMRQEVRALKSGLEGELRLAVIPAASRLAVRITRPFQAAHPRVRISIRQRGSSEIARMLENVEADAGISYLNEGAPGQVLALPLLDERYRLLTPRDGELGGRDRVEWADVGGLQLCLLTPEMQDGHHVTEMLNACGTQTGVTLQSDSTDVLLACVESGTWSGILPQALVEDLGLPPSIASIPIGDPDAKHPIGLVTPRRAEGSPMVSALVAEARKLARSTARRTPGGKGIAVDHAVEIAN